MKKLITIVCALCAFCAVSCNVAEQNTYSIIPQPVSVVEKIDTAIVPEVVTIDVTAFPQIAANYISLAAPMLALEQGDRDSYIILRLNKCARMAEGGYSLKVGKNRVVISSNAEAGLWNGLQTLTQLLLQGIDHQVTVNDVPRFGYRGAMLDCGRHFFTVEEVKQFIDLMCVHKLNVFHWHLTEDQGWRIEIKKYPLLTEVGSVRNGSWDTNYEGKEDKWVEGSYGGFYTQDEIREVVKYASERFVTIIPEIEMPGHSVAALTCYPWLGCTGGPYEVRTAWGISKDVMCIGKESTWEFCRDVLEEVCDLFPGPYIHIGGDEAPRLRWESCPDCQALMEKEGFEREAQLQTYLNNKVEEYLATKGKRVIGWDEILEGGISQTACVMSWRGSEGGQKAAAMGNDVIMVDKHYCYFDCYQTESREEEIRCHNRSVPLAKVWTYEPTDNMDEAAAAHVLGLQCNTWTEHISDMDRVYFMNLPRMAALCEIAWTDRALRGTYEQFLDRMVAVAIPLYNAAGWHVAPYYQSDLLPQD